MFNDKKIEAIEERLTKIEEKLANLDNLTLNIGDILLEDGNNGKYAVQGCLNDVLSRILGQLFGLDDEVYNEVIEIIGLNEALEKIKMKYTDPKVYDKEVENKLRKEYLLLSILAYIFAVYVINKQKELEVLNKKWDAKTIKEKWKAFLRKFYEIYC